MVRHYQPTGWKRAAWLAERYKHILPIEQRGAMPETRPDEDFVGHKLMCNCKRCQLPSVQRMKKLAFRRQIRAVADSPGTDSQ